MQISTREEDFLIDTISLREDLQVLNEIFTDPAILKVLFVLLFSSAAFKLTEALFNSVQF